MSDKPGQRARRARIEKPTLAAVITREVREQVISGEILPGSQLNEVELAARFATSRGPVREGLQRLVQEGILVSQPRRGLFVPVLTLTDLEDVYFARAAVERAAILRLVERGVPAAGIAELDQALAEMELALEEADLAGVAKADLRFHEVLVARAGSPRLQLLYTMLTGQARLGLNLVVKAYEGHGEDLVAEHRAILRRLVARDATSVLQMLEHHFGRAVESLSTEGLR